MKKDAYALLSEPRDFVSSPSFSRRQVLSVLFTGTVLLSAEPALCAAQTRRMGKRRTGAAKGGRRYGAVATADMVSTLSAETAAAIDSAVNSFQSANKIPGIALSVIQGSAAVYRNGYGTTDLMQNHPPDSQTIFQIDSLTKAFTAFAILHLHDQKKLDVTRTVGTYLPTLPNPLWKDILISELLSMSGGLPDASSTTLPYTQILEQTAARKTKYKTGLDFAPGTKTEYSNANYFLLGELADVVSPQKSFDRYTRRSFLMPLGMADTGLTPFATGPRYCTPYINGKAQEPRRPECGYSGGGFVSTIADMEKFAAALHERKILKPGTYDLMWTPQKLKTGKQTGWGLGWNLKIDSSGKTVQASKNGGGWGWSTKMLVYPQSNISVIIFANSAGIDPLANTIGRIVAGV